VIHDDHSGREAGSRPLENLIDRSVIRKRQVDARSPDSGFCRIIEGGGPY
jgi:hypothetical protein